MEASRHELDRACGACSLHRPDCVRRSCFYVGSAVIHVAAIAETQRPRFVRPAYSAVVARRRPVDSTRDFHKKMANRERRIRRRYINQAFEFINIRQTLSERHNKTARVRKDRDSGCRTRPGLFQVAGIVEQDSQLDAAVAELRKVLFHRVRRIQRRSGVIRRKQDE